MRRHVRLERCAAKIVERERRRADEHDPARNRIFVEIALKDTPGRHVAFRARAGVPDADRAIARGVRFDTADPDGGHPRGFREI